MGGGGGSSGGAVVGGPSPFGAMQAGQFQVQAANEAADSAREMVNNAILSINKNYQQGRYDLQPYRTEGVQALNQLNQYLGLDPYNPGIGPTAPTIPTLENAMAKVTKSQISSGIRDNIAPAFNNSGGFFGNYNADGNPYLQGIVPNGMGVNAEGVNSSGGPGIAEGSMGNWLRDVNVQNAIRKQIAEEQYLPQMQADYEINKAAYDQNLAEYNQNLEWYNKYKSEGPKTQEQIATEMASQPGYQAELSQGIDAIQKANAARGSLGSGRVLKELNQFGQNTLSTYYNNTLSRLSGLAGMGQQAASQSAQQAQQNGAMTGQAYIGLGDTLANAALARGNAQAQATLAANQQYKVIGGNDGGGGGMGGIGQALGVAGQLAGLFSSKTLKDKVSNVSKEEILKSVEALNIDKWKYKEVEGTHIGPYAEEFRDQFGVGDGKTINLIDAIGVLFASVKALSTKIDSIKNGVV